LAATEAREPFPALPGAAREIEAIIKDPGAGENDVTASAGTADGTVSSGDAVLPGRSYLNGDFTLETLEDSLASKAQIVHIASHFRLVPGNIALSELLLGDGSMLGLDAISKMVSLDFNGLDILTLSACDTASGEVKGDGAEVEGFGEIVQNRGASAVLASLWPVDDLSTAFLMREFSRLRYIEGMGKSEALRGAQTAVMRAGPDGTLCASGAGGAAGSSGTAGAAGNDGTDNRGSAISAVGATGAAEAGTGASGTGANDSAATPRWEGSGWSHPYYWAPFVLMGNWR
jgi:CHAT domain-containing protein